MPDALILIRWPGALSRRTAVPSHLRMIFSPIFAALTASRVSRQRSAARVTASAALGRSSPPRARACSVASVLVATLGLPLGLVVVKFLASPRALPARQHLEVASLADRIRRRSYLPL